MPVDIPLKDIYFDAGFNVREAFGVPQVIELARNIEENGLAHPILVQPYDKIPGYKYRIIAGHRRFRAYEAQEWQTIPCDIRANVTDQEAIIINFVENVVRQDLNILEEARGLKRLQDTGLNIEAISRKINKGKQWIKIRLDLLNQPNSVQTEAAAGVLTQEQIREINNLPTEQAKVDAVRRVKDLRIKDGQRGVKIKEKLKSPTKRKARTPAEVGEMLSHIMDNIGPCLLARGLAWVRGDISDVDLTRDLIEYAKEHDINYKPPEYVQEYLKQAG